MAGRINILGLLLLVGFVVGGLWLWTFGIYYWDRQVMKEICKATVLEWNSLGQTKGERRLAGQLQKRGLADYIYPEDCVFRDGKTSRVLSCAWAVEVKYPFVDRYKTLDFELTSEVSQGDLVIQY